MNTNYGNWPTYGLGYNMYDFLFDELMPLVYGWFPRVRQAGRITSSPGCRWAGGGPVSTPSTIRRSSRRLPVCRRLPGISRRRAEKEPGLWERTQKSFPNYGGKEGFLAGPENTWEIVKEKAKTDELPRLYFACGEDDMLYPAFKDFRKYAGEIGLEATFETIPGYKHEWRFWDLTIQKALKFFGLDVDGAGNPF